MAKTLILVLWVLLLTGCTITDAERARIRTQMMERAAAYAEGDAIIDRVTWAWQEP